MRRLNLNENSLIIAGDRGLPSRLKRQLSKCRNGSLRACRRAERMFKRME